MVGIFKIGDKGSIKFEKSDHYVVRLKFEEVSNYIIVRKDKKEFFTLTKKEQIELLRNLIKNGTLKVQSNDFSWLFQGMWERASDLGYSVFIYKGVKGQDIWANRHNKDVYVSKHIKEVLTTLPFIVDEIRKKLEDKYNK